jgi:hypothetical protein
MVAEEKIEDETYSLIYTSLKHPVRRRILRMLSQKPLSYSEILEALTIDSGHLSYHLESLGELISHTKDGKYLLSSFGVAALRLMTGVEELPPQTPTKKRRIARFLPKVLSLLLAISLVVASIHFVTCTVPITASLNQNGINPTAFFVNASQPYEFNITFILINNSIKSNNSTAPLFFIGTYGAEPKLFQVASIIDNPDAQAKGVMWLDFIIPSAGYSPVPGTYNGTLPKLAPMNLIVDVCMSNENKSLGALQRNHDNIHFTSPTVEVNQEGTYRFVIRTDNSSEWITHYNGSVTPILQWQITEKPYVSYGILGFVISAGYIALVSYNVLKSKTKITS